MPLPIAQPSILSRIGGLVPDYKPFTTPTGGNVRRRPQPGTEEKIPSATAAAAGDRIWFLPYADATATDDTPEIREAMRLMIRDPYVKSAWLSQVLTVLSQPFQVHPPKKMRKNPEAQEQADFIRHCLENARGGMLDVGTAILTNLGSDGFSLAEKVWQIEPRGKYANRLTLQALKPKDIDEHGRLIGDAFNNVTGVYSSRTSKTYPISDFVYCRYMHLYDEPCGMAAFRPSYGSYWSRDTVRKLRIIHKEKMLDGLLMGYYTDPADKPTLEAALARARSSTWLSIPEGVRIEQLSKSQASETDYKSFDESLREETLVGIALAHLHILQGGVSDARGNTAVHKSIADLGPWLLTYIVQYALNRQVIPDLIDYNYPFTSEYPTVSLGGVENAEIIEMLQVLEGAQRAGFNPSRNYYATELTIQEADPTDPTDRLAAPQPAMGLPGGGLPPGGADPFGGMGGGGVDPLDPAGGGLPPAPAPGGEFGGFKDANTYTVFGWDDWRQVAGGKWVSASGKRTLSDPVYQRLSKRASASKPPTPVMRAPQRPQLEGGTAGHPRAAEVPQQKADRLVRLLSGSIKRTPQEIQAAAAGFESWPDHVLSRAHQQLTGGNVNQRVPRAAAVATIRGKLGVVTAEPKTAPPPRKGKGGRVRTFGEHGYIDVFGWDDWDARGQHMVSPGGRVLRRETWERLKAANPASDAPAAGRPQQPKAKPPMAADRHIQARLDRIRGNKPATLAETEGDVRAAAAELGTAPPPAEQVIDLVKQNTAGLDPAVQGELGQRLAAAASAGSPDGVKGGWRSLAEWAAGLPVKAATAAVRGLLWFGKKMLFNTRAAFVAPVGDFGAKVKRTTPAALKYLGVLALNAGLFAASIAVPVLLPVAWSLKLGIAAVTTAAAAGWLTVGFGAKRMLRKAGQEVMTRWTGEDYQFDPMQANAIEPRAGHRTQRFVEKIQVQRTIDSTLARFPKEKLDGLRVFVHPTGPTVWIDQMDWHDGEAGKALIKAVAAELGVKAEDVAGREGLAPTDTPRLLVQNEGPTPPGGGWLECDDGRGWTNFAEAEAGEEIALAGKDGKRAAELMSKSITHGKGVLGRMTEQAVARLLTDPDPLGATVLFSDDEMQQIASSLSATTAAADLLGRSRVRRLAHHAKANAEKFNEMMGYPEMGVPPAVADPDPFDVFADAPEPMPANAAANYFRGLVPDLGVDARRYGPSLDRHAFTLSVAADQAVLNRVKQVILDQIESGRRPFAVADIQDELDAAGVGANNPQYAEMVYRTNMNDAYMQGFSQEMQAPDMQQEFPAWQYLGIRDGRQGEDHEPHFDRYYPNTATFAEVRGPRVFNCRCSAAPIHRVEWDRLKREGTRTEGGW